MTRRLLAPSLFALMAASPAFAQQTEVAQDAQPGQLLPEVVASASRTPIQSEAVGSAMTVITAEQLEQRQTRLVSDILRDVPGVSVNRAGPRGTNTQVRIRGTEARHVLVVIDGVEANDIPGGSEFNWAHLLAGDVDRIEVLRGNQSALWGSDAIGGVINITTKRGQKGVQMGAYGEVGSFTTKTGGASLRGGTDTFDYAFSANGLKTNGTNVSRFGGEQDGYKNFTGNFKANWRPVEGVEIGGTLRGVRSTTEYDATDQFSANPTGLPFDTDNVTQRRETYGRAFGKLTSLGGAWDNQVSAAFTNTHNTELANGAWASENAGKKTKIDYLSTYRLSTPSFANSRHTFTFLAERENEEFDQSAIPADFAPAQKHEWTNHALGGEYRVDLFDSLFLSGSLRHDFNEQFKDRTTGRVTAAYLYAPTQTRLHTSYGTGSKNPSFLSLYGYYNNYIGNPDLKPETSRGWDLGVEQSFLNQRASVDVTYFQQTVTDLITADFSTGVGRPFNQTGDSKSKGIEISGRVTPIDNVDLRGSYTYLHADDPSGREQIRRPRHQASLSVNYRFLEDRASINLSWDYNGRSIDNFFQPVSPYATIRTSMKDYSLINLGGTYRILDNIDVYARVENLLDQKYEEILGYRATGIGAYAGIRWAFNR